MANFPTSLDSYTANVDNVDVIYASDVNELQEAIVALETKMGVNSSAVTTTHDYKLGEVTGSDKAVGKTATQTLTNKTLTSPVINVGSDATGDMYYRNAGVLTRIPVGTDNQILKLNGATPNWEVETAQDTTLYVPTGMVSPYAGSSAPSTWLLCDGSAISRTTYAALFAVTGTTYGVGDGSTTFNIPDLRSRIPTGAGTGTKVATFASRSGDVITVTGLTNASNNEFQTGQAVLYSAPSGAMTGLTHNTTYYIVRVTNTTFSLATTLANAQNGTVITLSSDGTGTQTFTKTLTTRTSGDTGGEENHAMSSTELLAHTHTINHGTSSGGGSGIVSNGNAPDNQSNKTSYSTGGNVAMNNMQPFVVLNYIIKT